MAIQHRRGDYNNFEPDKMVAGEFAYINSNDPSTEDGKGVYATFSGGITKRMCTYNEVSGLVDLAKGYRDESLDNRNDSERTSILSKSYAVGGTGSRAGEDTDNAKYYCNQAKAIIGIEVATLETAGIVRPDGDTISVDTDGTIHVNYVTGRGNFSDGDTTCEIEIDIPDGDYSMKIHSTSKNLFVTDYSYTSNILTLEFNKQTSSGTIFVETRKV